jgi:hypothetical protein
MDLVGIESVLFDGPMGLLVYELPAKVDLPG